MYDEKMVEVSRVVYLLDIFFTAICFLLAYWIRVVILPENVIDFFSHASLFPLLLSLIIGSFSYFGCYEIPKNLTGLQYAWPVLRSIAFSIGVMLMILFFFNIEYVSRTFIGIFAIIEFLMVFSGRVWLRAYYLRSMKKGSKTLHVLIIGTGERARGLSFNLRKQAEWGIKVVGHLDPDPLRIGQKIIDAPVIGTIGDVSNVLKNNVVDEVIIAIPRSLLENANDIALACEEEGIKLQFMADVFNVNVARVRLTKAGDIPLLTLEPVAQDEIKLLYKRLFDFILTFLSLPMLLPLALIIAAAIKLDSKGPVFFIQQRVGLKKRLFPMIKFRSMYIDAEEKLKEIEHLNEAEGPIFKIKDDPRVTRVGKFLRKTSLDEIPQLFNVLWGHMSLVGPRPMSIRDVDLFDKGIQRKRFSVKPGITCIWQISGRSDLPFEKWLELDLEYIEKWNLWLDIKILIMTVPAVFYSKGAV